MEKVSNPVSDIAFDALKNLKTVFDVDNVVGKPVDLGNGEKVFPIVKVCAGFVGGGGEFVNKKIEKKRRKSLPFAGGSSAGFSASPVGFLVVRKDKSEMVTVENENAYAAVLKNISTALSDFIKSKGKQSVKNVEDQILKTKNAKKEG